MYGSYSVCLTPADDVLEYMFSLVITEVTMKKYITINAVVYTVDENEFEWIVKINTSVFTYERIVPKDMCPTFDDLAVYIERTAACNN